MNTIKTIIISALFLTMSVFSANAQKEFYQKYSGKEGVTKVYISKALFSLIGSAEGMDVNIGNTGDKLDVGKLAKNLDGLYILTTENKSLSKEMEADFKVMLNEYKLELLMEAVDGRDEVKMYVSRDGKDITNFFMHSYASDGELVIIYLGGRIPEDDLMAVMKASMNDDEDDK